MCDQLGLHRVSSNPVIFNGYINFSFFGLGGSGFRSVWMRFSYFGGMILSGLIVINYIIQPFIRVKLLINLFYLRLRIPVTSPRCPPCISTLLPTQTAMWVFCSLFFNQFWIFVQIFDERTSRKTNIQMCFHSKYGKKEEAKNMTNVGKAASKREGHVQAA